MLRAVYAHSFEPLMIDELRCTVADAVANADTSLDGAAVRLVNVSHHGEWGSLQVMCAEGPGSRLRLRSGDLVLLVPPSGTRGDGHCAHRGATPEERLEEILGLVADDGEYADDEYKAVCLLNLKVFAGTDRRALMAKIKKVRNHSLLEVRVIDAAVHHLHVMFAVFFVRQASGESAAKSWIWRAIPLESISTAAREFGALQALRQWGVGSSLCRSLLGLTVKEDALVALSMRLMKEAASTERTTAVPTESLLVDVLMNNECNALVRTIDICSSLAVNEQVLRSEAGQTVIAQLKSLKHHWQPDIVSKSKGAITQWKLSVSEAMSSTDRHKSASPPVLASGIPSRPSSLTAHLWSSLCQSYNSPQLHAIAAACNLCRAPSGGDSVLLLQGPPGTGKTRTVLGILSALFADSRDSEVLASGQVVRGEPKCTQHTGYVLLAMPFAFI